MKRIDYKFNSVIRILLVLVIIFGIANKMIGKGDVYYYITEAITWISAFGAFALIVIKNEIKDRIFEKEWA